MWHSQEYFTPFTETIIYINPLKLFRQIALNQFTTLKEKPYSFSLGSNKLWLSVSKASTFLFLSREFIMNITTMQCILVCFVIFLFYIAYTRVVALNGLGSFNPLKTFKPDKTLKLSIINAFLSVVLCALNLILRYLKVLNF